MGHLSNRLSPNSAWAQALNRPLSGPERMAFENRLGPMQQNMLPQQNMAPQTPQDDILLAAALGMHNRPPSGPVRRMTADDTRPGLRTQPTLVPATVESAGEPLMNRMAESILEFAEQIPGSQQHRDAQLLKNPDLALERPEWMQILAPMLMGTLDSGFEFPLNAAMLGDISPTGAFEAGAGGPPIAKRPAPTSAEGLATVLSFLPPTSIPIAFDNAQYKETGPGSLAEMLLGTLDLGLTTAALRPVVRAGVNVAEDVINNPSVARFFADERGSLMGTGSDGRRPTKMTDTVDLRALTPDEAIVVARTEQHLIQSPDGQYVGAPRGVRSQAGIDLLRQNFDAQVDLGEAGADWYVRGRDFNAEVTGLPPEARFGAESQDVVPGTPGIGHNQPPGYVRPDAALRARLLARSEGLWSAQADPDPNMNFVLQAHNAYEAGRPESLVRTSAMVDRYNNARDAGLEVPLGPKTRVYGEHLDSTREFGTTGTNDIWHARAFGFKANDGTQFDRALSATEHRWLDYETILAVDRANARNMGGRSDWTAHEIQAAPWVAGKAQGLLDKRPNLGTLENATAQATKGYPDAADKYTAYGTYEQVPGNSTGFLPEVMDYTLEGKRIFGDQASWNDVLGRDRIYDDMNFNVRPTVEGTGVYRNAAGGVEYNPSYVARPMVPLKDGLVSPRDQTALTAGEAARGYVDLQEGSPWNKVSGQALGSRSASFNIDLGRPATPQEIAALDTLGKKYNLDVGNTDRGVAFLNSAKLTTREGTKLLKAIEAEIDTLFPGATVNRGVSNSGYVDQSANLALANAGQGQATMELISRLEKLKNEAPGMYEKLLSGSGVSDKARMNLQRLYDYDGRGQRPDYEEALRVISESGLQGLLDRVLKYGPAGLPAVGVGVATQNDERPRSSPNL